MRKLKVFTTNYDGRSERIVATTSRKEACALIGTSLGDFKNYGHETGNKECVELALSEPGVVWERKYRGNSTWERLS